MVLIHSIIPLNAWIVCIQLFVISLFRFALEFGYQVPACGDLPGPNSPPEWWYTLIGNVHYLHFGVILFGISAAVAIAVSYLTEPIDEKHLHRLTFWTRHSKYVRIDLDEDTQYNTTSDKTGMIFASESTDRCIILVLLSRRKNWIGESPRSCRVLRRTIQTETVSCSLFLSDFPYLHSWHSSLFPALSMWTQLSSWPSLRLFGDFMLEICISFVTIHLTCFLK